jgi:hypothetical protein
MFEKLCQMAEKAANGVSLSRRGFFSRFAALAGVAALGVMALWPSGAHAGGDKPVCYCKIKGVVYCACYGNDPNLFYCCSQCAQFCKNHGANLNQ